MKTIEEIVRGLLDKAIQVGIVRPIYSKDRRLSSGELVELANYLQENLSLIVRLSGKARVQFFTNHGHTLEPVYTDFIPRIGETVHIEVNDKRVYCDPQGKSPWRVAQVAYRRPLDVRILLEGPLQGEGWV